MRPSESAAELKILLVAAGGRPADALVWVQNGQAGYLAQSWQALPKAMARGDVTALAEWTPTQALDALQKLCHDVWAVRAGAQPRFFSMEALSAVANGSNSNATNTGMYALANWSKELAATARTVEHPYNPGLMLESLASRARLALSPK